MRLCISREVDCLEYLGLVYIQMGNRVIFILWNHFQARLIARLLSMSFFITFATAISKSYWVTWIRRSLRANIPAYVQTAFDSAPDAPIIFYPIFLRSIPLIRFIFLE